MQFLTAAVVLVGALCAIDLLLTVAVTRRLRQHQTALAELRRHAMPRPPSFLAHGAGLPRFAAITVDGEAVSQETLAEGRTAIAFLRADCTPCRDRVPELRELAATTPEARTLAVVGGGVSAAAEIVEHLREV